MRTPLILLLALLLASCGQLPRPFQPEVKGNNQLLVLPDRTGISVASVTGAVPDGEAMAEAMAEALRRENVPATVAVGNEQSRWLMGHAEAMESGGSETVRRRFVWELFDARGEPVGQVERTANAPRAAWQASESELLQRLAAAAAPEIAAMIQGPKVLESELPGFPAGTQLVVAPVAGGPPEFGRALMEAMARRLRQRDLPLADRAQPGDVVISANLTLADGEQAGQSALELVWTLAQQGKDTNLGTLRQANPVQTSRMQEQPERLADLIVRAALPGVMQVLDRGAD